MRLIDADELKTAFPCGESVKTECVRATIDHMPTIEPKKGKWIKREDRAGWYCSECATDDYYAYFLNSDTGVYELQDKFCPNCGAGMRKGKIE